MNKYKVVFEVFRDFGKKEIKTVEVEAGNKKLACLRGMSELNKIPGYGDLMKTLKTVEAM